MKFFYPIVILLFLFSNCKKKESSPIVSKSDTSQISDSSKIKDFKISNKDTIKKIVNYYVKAVSGLNYRDSPHGKVLGKFPFNTKLEIVKRTGIFEDIKDVNKLINGEWFGVTLHKDTVFVFNAFLSKNKVEIVAEESIYNEEDFTIKYSNFKIYNLNVYKKSQNKKTGFIPLTDAYPWSEHPDSLAVSNIYLGNKKVRDYHILNKKYRSRFLKRMSILESDKVFLYNFYLDSLFTFRVKNLPVLAHMSIYGTAGAIRQYDYLIGFDLESALKVKNLDSYYTNSFVYVGKSNPFIRGKLKPMLWKKLEDAELIAAELKDVKGLPLSSISKIGNLHKFQANGMRYYVIGRSQLIIVDSNSKKIICNRTYLEGESTSNNVLRLAGKDYIDTDFQWTGYLFKNKPPVVFGFQYVSFGCPSIDFIENPNSSIYLLCDNRH